MEFGTIFVIIFGVLTGLFALAVLIWLMAAQHKSSKEYSRAIDEHFDYYAKVILGNQYKR
ncbi:MAG: hypothetical protein IJ341_01995 [Bacteroidales bacterium]|nr:hypothetical protein [Bacteroidales bacterium]